MEIKLVSEDEELYKLCREILTDIPGRRWALSAVSAQNAGSDGDLYIWDFQPGILLPEHIYKSSAKHLFLVNRQDVAEFQVEMGSAGPLMLLKPVTRAALATFLTLAVTTEVTSSLMADRDEILQCLIQTNLKLQEYDQDRTNFLARAIHDFRAPLTAVSGYCGLMLSGPLGSVNEKQREVLGRMHHSVQRLSRLAESMYQLSIGNRIKTRPNVQKGEIRVCVEQAVHEIAPFADDKQITIVMDVESSPSLSFEAGQIEQVLINILHNACKFTPKFGCIEIRGHHYFWDRRNGSARIPAGSERRSRASRETNSYRIDIRDSGKPIPEDRMDRIFEEYISYAGSSDRSGGGLGLAICRMIVAQHEGRIWAENTDLGPMFSFTLPVGRSDLRREQAEVELQGVIS
jgi:signal transduction histidine kinase